MKFKRYHGFIQTGLFTSGLFSVITWLMLVWVLFGNLSNHGTEKDKILVLLFLAFAPLICLWIFMDYVRSTARRYGGHFMDEIEINHEGIGVYSQKAGDLFLPWENVYEVLKVRHFRAPFEILVRGINGEINFFGNGKAEKYIVKQLGIKTKQAPSDWKKRTDWRSK